MSRVPGSVSCPGWQPDAERAESAGGAAPGGQPPGPADRRPVHQPHPTQEHLHTSSCRQ
jgi:hypothetical protein